MFMLFICFLFICYLPLLYSVEGHLAQVNVTQDHPVFGECQNYLNEW